MECLAAVVVLIVLRDITVSFAQLDVEIYPREEPTLKEPRDSVLLNCTVSSGGPVRSLTWTKNSRLLKSVNNSVGPVYCGLGLVLNGNRTSAGLYRCQAVGEDNETGEASIIVHVKGKPQIIRDNSMYTRSPQMQGIGDDLELMCYATGYPKVHFEWLRNGAPVIFDGSNYRKIPEKNGLNIVLMDFSEKDDEATFTCMAKNEFGIANHTIQVLTRDPPPKIVAQTKSKNVNLGKRNVTLVCTIENALNPTTFWKFKGTTYQPGNVYDDYTVVQELRSMKTSLIINNEVSERDEGNFTCGLIDWFSRVQDSMYLSVEEPRDVHLAKSNVGVYVGLSVSVGFILLIAAVIVWRRKIRKRPIDFPSSSFQKDVFITYSSNDYEWVEEYLVPLFERHGVQYIIHIRDFELGKPIVENVADSVYQSRRVLVVMSKNYMASGFCRDVLQMALRESLDDEMVENSVIVIRIDDICKNKLPNSVRYKTFFDFTSKEERATWEERLLKTVKPPEPLPASQNVPEESEGQPLFE